MAVDSTARKAEHWRCREAYCVAKLVELGNIEDVDKASHLQKKR
jgi:hypothetical protein